MGNMKANRKFVEEKEAVSAVIGVILMVAITVAIAATVYVYVRGMIGESPQTTPNLQMIRSNTETKLTVSSADPGNLKWDHFEIILNNRVQDDLTNFTATSVDFTENIDVNAGQHIQLDTTVVTLPATIAIRHKSTNTLINSWTFN
jgi:flagellin-like protein